MDIIEEIRDQLYHLSEEDYKEFNRKLLPGVDQVLGIRVPALKQLAKSIVRRMLFLIWMRQPKNSQ